MAKEEKKKGRDGEDVDFNEMWNVVYKLQEALKPIMPSKENPDQMCPKTKFDSCPSGHMLAACETGFYCKQCSEETFQPNENWVGDKCRLRKNCDDKPKMDYRDPGSTVRDADCKCKPGYHFPNEDQRSCIPNKSCPKGFASGIYGNCESCLKKSGYSDTVGRAKTCKTLTNCAKQHRCTLVRSNGMQDNVCGPVVSDLKTCEELEPSSSSSSSTTTYAIACSVAGFLIFIVVIVVILVFLTQRRRKHNRAQRPLTVEEMEELRQRVLKECDRNPSLCKKVFSTSCSFIEERIDRQRWTLAQELFRPHPTHGMYEVLVGRYKDSQAKYTINGYLQEFKGWQGETKDAVSELFRCLHQVKRDDIVNEICMTLRTDVGYQVDDFVSIHHKKDPYPNKCCPLSFCQSKSKASTAASSSSSTSSHHHQQQHHPGGNCASTTVMVEAREAETKLLAIASDDIDEDDDVGKGGDGGSGKPPGTFYHAHPCPSAPALEDNSDSILPDVDSVKYSRQYSQPVQATS